MAATYAWTQNAAQEDPQQASLEQAIVSQKVDPSWAPRAEASLHHSLKLLSAQCRATICRMEIAPSDSKDTSDFDLSFRRMLLHRRGRRSECYHDGA
jgi:hypothetical protein